MEAFEISIGQSRRTLRLEPQQQPKQFKLYATDRTEEWIDHGLARDADLPPDGYLGTMKIESETVFDFDGSGTFTGEELHSIAAQVVKHPDFEPSTNF